MEKSSLVRFCEDLKEVDIEENLDVLFSYMNKWNGRVIRYEVELNGSNEITNEDLRLFFIMVDELMSEVINFRNINRVFIVNLWKDKYYSSDNEIKYEKLMDDFDKLRDIFDKLVVMVGEMREFMLKSERDINMNIKNLVKSVGTMINRREEDKEVSSYGLNLMKFCESNLNKCVDYNKVMRVVEMRVFVKRLKWLGSLLEEVLIMVYNDYGNIKKDVKFGENSLLY